MKNFWLPPEPKAFERLNVQDGLLIDAHKWRLEQGYVRKRHSYHYQSLHQGGIVCGLEVGIIPPPSNVRPEHRTGRWIEISPGVAIDYQGNIIVIPSPKQYRIDGTVPPQKASQTIYIVLRYRDPEDLHGYEKKEIVTEQFRLNEKTDPPGVGEVEICRFEILPSEVELKPATDVFYPGYNTLDLRHRPKASVRAQGVVKAAIYNFPHTEQSDLWLLLSCLKGLYPFLEGDTDIEDTLLIPEENNELLHNDLLYIAESEFSGLEPLQKSQIQQFIKTGGTILIVGSLENSTLAQLANSQQELQQAIAKVKGISVFAQRQEELQQELNEITQSFNSKFQNVQNLIKQLGVELTYWNDLPSNHPIKIEPFFFNVPPDINGYQNQIWMGDGVIFLLGNLFSAYNLSSNLGLTREILRNAQEMGVNLLHYAWRRQLLLSTQKLAVSKPQTTSQAKSQGKPQGQTAPNPTVKSKSESTPNIPTSASEEIKPSTPPSQKRKQPKPSDLL
jgi:hypothetical protein